MRLKISISVVQQCLRSAAKNHQYVTVVVDPADYEKVIEELKADGETTIETRRSLQQKYSVIQQHMMH